MTAVEAALEADAVNRKESIYKQPPIPALSRTITVFLYQAQDNFIFLTWYSTILIGSNFLY